MVVTAVYPPNIGKNPQQVILRFLPGSRLVRGLVVRTLAGVALGGRVLRRPEGEVVPQQLHDEGRVLVRLLGESVELCDRIVERLPAHNNNNNNNNNNTSGRDVPDCFLGLTVVTASANSQEAGRAK